MLRNLYGNLASALVKPIGIPIRHWIGLSMILLLGLFGLIPLYGIVGAAFSMAGHFYLYGYCLQPSCSKIFKNLDY